MSTIINGVGRVGIRQSVVGSPTPAPSYPTSLKLFIDAGNPLSYPGTGTVVTDLTGTQNGTLVNGTSYSSANGGTFVLDGINDYINFGANVHNYQALTYSIWFKKTDDARVMILFQNFNGDAYSYCGYQLMIYNGTPSFIINTGTNGYGPGVAGNSLTNGVWTCITARKVENGNLSIFQNGILVGTTTSTSPITYSSGSINNTSSLIGVQSNVGFPTSGNIGVVKMYNEARTDAQILTDFNEFKSRYGY
jgi:hypothetical protein